MTNTDPALQSLFNPAPTKTNAGEQPAKPPRIRKPAAQAAPAEAPAKPKRRKTRVSSVDVDFGALTACAKVLEQLRPPRRARVLQALQELFG